MPRRRSRAVSRRKGGKPSRAPYCFVVMPFKRNFDDYYKRIYAPAIRAAGLEPRRGDDVFRAGIVMKQLWEQICGAELVLADVTERNPNVFYELGLAHASRKPAILVTQNPGDVPFDLRHLRRVEYKTVTPTWAKQTWDKDLKKDLRKAIDETRAAPMQALAFPAIAVPSTTRGGPQSEVLTRLSLIDFKLDLLRRQAIATTALAEEKDDRQPTGRQRAMMSLQAEVNSAVGRLGRRRRASPRGTRAGTRRRGRHTDGKPTV
jgi:hypothetical protein